MSARRSALWHAGVISCCRDDNLLFQCEVLINPPYRNLGEGAYLGKLCSIRDADAAERKMNYTPRPQVFYEPWDDYSHGFFV